MISLEAFIEEEIFYLYGDLFSHQTDLERQEPTLGQQQNLQLNQSLQEDLIKLSGDYDWLNKNNYSSGFHNVFSRLQNLVKLVETLL